MVVCHLGLFSGSHGSVIFHNYQYYQYINSLPRTMGEIVEKKKHNTRLHPFDITMEIIFFHASA